MLQEIGNNGFTWVDVGKPAKADMVELGRRFHFHELNLADCLSKIQIPKIDRYEDHIFVILHFPMAEHESIPKSSQLAAFLGSGYLVTVHQGDLKPLVEMFEHCRENEKARQELMGKSAGYLFHSIVDTLTDDLFNVIRKVVGNIDDIEDIVFDEKSNAAKEISHVRRQITSLRRITIPLRRTLTEITSRDIQKFSEENLTDYFDDVKDHIDKAIDTLEESRETVEIYKDTDYMHGTDKSNKILAVLTIIFTLSMPATIISSLYGMNVALPIIDPDILGGYATFIVTVSISAILALGMVFYFRKIRWI
jgi:magnesium transporter